MMEPHCEAMWENTSLIISHCAILFNKQQLSDIFIWKTSLPFNPGGLAGICTFFCVCLKTMKYSV